VVDYRIVKGNQILKSKAAYMMAEVTEL